MTDSGKWSSLRRVVGVRTSPDEHPSPNQARTFALLIALAILVLVPAAPASAHATLLFTSPAVDGAVPDSPPVVQLVFDQPILAGQTSLIVESVDGAPAPVGPVETGEDSSVVRVPVLEDLAAGEYRIEWQVVARDGDAMVGDFRFVVGSGSALRSGGSQAATQGAWPMGVLRWGLFIGFALALGGLVGRWLERQTTPKLATPGPWLNVGAATGLASAGGLTLLTAGGGSLVRGLGPARLGGLIDSTPGLVALVEVAALAIALAAFTVHRDRVGGMALLVLPVAEGIRSHPGVQAGDWGAVLISVHLTAAAVWSGALVHVLRICRALRRTDVAATPVLRAYARMALALFLVVLLTGALSAVSIIPLDDLRATLLDTSYGRWILVKVGLVLLVGALAGWARRHLRRRPDEAQPERSARTEVAAIAGVFAISSALTVLAPPVAANVPLAFAPPDVGPAIGLGTRAGFVAVAVSASQSQIVVKLSTPSTAESRNRNQEAIDLTGNLAPLGAALEELEFRRCGLGCFVAPASWQSGDNLVTLRIDDQRWGGGRAAVEVTWPAQHEDERLRAAVARLRKVEHFTLHEQVTSDTHTGLGTRRRLRVSGEDYLAAGPFSSGRAVSVTVQHTHPGGEVTLALAYPAEKVYVLLTIDQQDRIVREVLASAEHFVTRTLVYDEPGSHEGHDHRG